MEDLLFYLIGIVGIIIIGRLLVLPLKIIFKLVGNAIVGGVVLSIINYFSQYTGLFIEITPIKALIVGILGVPGVVITAIL